MVASRVVSIPKEVHNRQALAGYESIPGVPVPPTFRLLGEYTSSSDRPDASKPEATGGLDRRVTPRKGKATFAGTYAEDVSFEHLPRLMRLGLVGGDPAVLVAGATAAYQRDQSPVFDRYAVDTVTVPNFVEGLGFQDKGVSFRQWNISGDVDDAEGVWKFSGDLFLRGQSELPGSFEGVVTGGSATTLVMTGAGWTVDQHAGKYVNLGVGSHTGQIRQVVSNTADTLTVSTAWDTDPETGDAFRIEGKFTSGIARPSVELIPTYGTKLYLDQGGALGTTRVRKRFISFNITVNHNLGDKPFMDDAKDEVGEVSPGEREVTGQVRLEFDRRDEMLAWERNIVEALRIEQEGSEIEPGIRKLARIDLPVIDWQTPNRNDPRNNNNAATFGFRALLPASDPIITVHTINGLASV